MRNLIALLCLTATPALADWVQIRLPEEFSEQVVDNTYVNIIDGAWFRFNADNTLSGSANGQTLLGQWAFVRGYACFERSLGGKVLPNDCIVVQVDGDQLVTVRDEGRGRQTVYQKQLQ